MTFPPLPAFTSHVYRTRCRARYELRLTLFLKRPPPTSQTESSSLAGERTCKKCKPKSVSSATARAATWVGEARAMFAERIKAFFPTPVNKAFRFYYIALTKVFEKMGNVRCMKFRTMLIVIHGPLFCIGVPTIGGPEGERMSASNP
jgi:hypothetical protein